MIYHVPVYRYIPKHVETFWRSFFPPNKNEFPQLVATSRHSIHSPSSPFTAQKAFPNGSESRKGRGIFVARKKKGRFGGVLFGRNVDVTR